MKLSRDQVEHKHLLWFVYGAVAEWNEASKAGINPVALERYQLSTLDKVCAYLFNNATIDGSYSDLQADISLHAAKVFGTREVQIRSVARSLTEAWVDNDCNVHLLCPDRDTGPMPGFKPPVQFIGTRTPIKTLAGGTVVLDAPYGTFILCY